MSPTVFREGPFRFFFFRARRLGSTSMSSRRTARRRFWLDPEIELARNHGAERPGLEPRPRVDVDHEQEIRDAWTRHFRS